MDDTHERGALFLRRFTSHLHQSIHGWTVLRNPACLVGCSAFLLTLTTMPAFGAIAVTRFDCAFGGDAIALGGGAGQTNRIGNVWTNWTALDVGATNVAVDGPNGTGVLSRVSVRQQSRLVGISSSLQLVTSGWLSLGGELKSGASGLALSSATNRTTLHFTVDSPCLLRLRSLVNDPTQVNGGFTLFSNLNVMVSGDWVGIHTNSNLAATNWWPYFVQLLPGNYRLLQHASGDLGVNVPGKFGLDASYQFELLLVDAASVAQAFSPWPRLTIRRMPADEISISWPINALQLQLFSRQTNAFILFPYLPHLTVVTNVALSDGKTLTARIGVDHGTWRVYRLVGRLD